MEIAELIFISCIVVLFYTYFGYGIILTLVVRFRKREALPSLADEDLPEITHVIAAYNEADIIAEKIENCLAQNYPADKVSVYVVTDGSTDTTPDIVSIYPQVKLFHRATRAGKLAAVNRVMKYVASPITIFSDANAMLSRDSSRNMVKHFQLSTVGAVAGEKTVLNEASDDAAAAGEGIYWKYESYLKKLDYQLNTVVGAAGELFAVRTHLYESPNEGMLIEDFVVTMNVAVKGYRVAYEPDAKAMEYSSESLADELKRKVRISAGGLQAVYAFRKLWNISKFGLLSFQYLSHRAFRWTIAPLALLGLFFANAILLPSESLFFGFSMISQILFYILAILGYVFSSFKMKIKAFFIPFYFLFMNYSVYVGLMRLVLGRTSVVWEKAKRR
jgi:cellulose synthase/poly-beta-1,6-N-acetylglucosamine synthase-like glycosyltransferase